MTNSFDVEAWLDEAAPPTRAVKLYGRADLVAQLQIGQSQDDPERMAPRIDDPRLGGDPVAIDGATSPLLLAELEASARTFIVRGLLDREQAGAIDRATTTEPGKAKHVDEALVETLLIELATVDPKLTADQAATLRERVGQAQWDALFKAIAEASQEPIDVPLSRLGSGTGQDS